MYCIEDVYTGDGIGNAESLSMARIVALEHCWNSCYRFAIWFEGKLIVEVSSTEIKTF